MFLIFSKQIFKIVKKIKIAALNKVLTTQINSLNVSKRELQIV